MQYALSLMPACHALSILSQLPQLRELRDLWDEYRATFNSFLVASSSVTTFIRNSFTLGFQFFLSCLFHGRPPVRELLPSVPFHFQFFLSCLSGRFPAGLAARLVAFNSFSVASGRRGRAGTPRSTRRALSILSQLPLYVSQSLPPASVLPFQFFLSCLPLRFNARLGRTTWGFQFFLSCLSSAESTSSVSSSTTFNSFSVASGDDFNAVIASQRAAAFNSFSVASSSTTPHCPGSTRSAFNSFSVASTRTPCHHACASSFQFFLSCLQALGLKEYAFMDNATFNSFSVASLRHVGIRYSHRLVAFQFFLSCLRTWRALCSRRR